MQDPDLYCEQCGSETIAEGFSLRPRFMMWTHLKWKFYFYFIPAWIWIQIFLTLFVYHTRISSFLKFIRSPVKKNHLNIHLIRRGNILEEAHAFFAVVIFGPNPKSCPFKQTRGGWDPMRRQQKNHEPLPKLFSHDDCSWPACRGCNAPLLPLHRSDSSPL